MMLPAPEHILEIQYLVFNRSWRISTTPNTTKFFFIPFKLIQQSNTYGHSELPREKSKFECEEKKVQFIPEKGGSWAFHP